MIELNGQQFRLVPIQEDEVAESEEFKQEQPVGLDLEAVIKELEDEINEEEGSDEVPVEESDNPYDNNEQHDSWVEGEKGSPSEVHGKEKFSEGEEEDEDKEEEIDIKIIQIEITVEMKMERS